MARSRGSWQDIQRTWAASGADPWSTYRYAGAAAHMAICLSIAGVTDPGDPLTGTPAVDWQTEATQACAWQQANTLSGDSTNGNFSLTDARSYAAAALFRLTGTPAYETQFIADTSSITASTWIVGDTLYGPMVYALGPIDGGGVGVPNATQLTKIRSALIASASSEMTFSVNQRALRWGGNYWIPMINGEQTTPMVLDLAVGYTLSRRRRTLLRRSSSWARSTRPATTSWAATR